MRNTDQVTCRELVHSLFNGEIRPADLLNAVAPEDGQMKILFSDTPDTVSGDNHIELPSGR